MHDSKRFSLYLAWRALCRHACLCAIVLAIATAFCVGVGVFLEETGKPHNEVSTFDLCSNVIYETAQILLLNMSTHLGSNAWISVGRILAVLFVVFLGIQAVSQLFGDSWQNLLLLKYERHHIVCGLGRIGWQLVQDLLKANQRVVVIENNPANELCHEARRRGAVVLIGDATNDEILRHARLKRARAVYVVTGSDEKNIEAAVDVQKLAHGNHGRPPADCYVHLVEPALTEVLRSSLRTVADKPMKVAAFNVMHNTVRNLIVKHLTPIRPSKPDEVALYVLVGFGRMGQTVAAHLAELAHFENRKRARLLILTPHAPAAADAFLSRFGQFSPRVVVDDWSKIAFDPRADEWSWRADSHRPGRAYRVEHPHAIEYVCNAVFAPLPAYIAERGFLDALAPLLQANGVKPAIIVCMDREQESYAAAVTLEQNLHRNYAMDDTRVFVWLPRQEPLKDLLTGERGRVTPFGSCRDELKLQHVIDPLEERLAKAIMAGFNGIDPHDAAAIEAHWQQDSELFRQSNRSAATHALIALRCLEVEIGKVKELASTPEQIVTLAQMEHNRWVAERLLAGFSYGEKSNQPPRRKQLCSWEVLSSDDALKKEPAKDFQQIATVFRTLRELG